MPRLILVLGILALVGVGGSVWLFMGDGGGESSTIDSNDDRSSGIVRQRTARADGNEDRKQSQGVVDNSNTSGARPIGEPKQGVGEVAGTSSVKVDGATETSETSEVNKPTPDPKPVPKPEPVVDLSKMLPSERGLHTAPEYAQPETGARRTVVFGAFGDGETRTALHTRPVATRDRGFLPNQPTINDKPKRRVHGRVVVQGEGGATQGLANVIITDWREIHRTFTDNDGYFDFEARFADGNIGNMAGLERDHDDNNDFVYLLAYADGYVMTGKDVQVNGNPGQRYYNGVTYGPQDVNSDKGLLITMKWEGAEKVLVKFTNPPTDASKITVTAESYSESQSQRDEGFFLSAMADKSGSVVFHVPNRRQIEFRAVGDKWRSQAPAVYDNTQKAWLITLVPSESNQVTGQVVDQRTGQPLANVRVRANSDREVSYTGSDGNFSLWVKSESPSVHLLCEHPHYIRANALLSESVTVPISLQSGGSVPTGPWRVTMRPSVRFKALISAADGALIERLQSVEISIQDNLNTVVHGTVANGAAVLDIQAFPWGAQKLTLVTADAANTQHKVYEVELSSSMWNDQEAYDLRLFAQARR